MRGSLSPIIALLVGFIVLLGYLLPFPFLMEARQALLHWAMILAAVALIVGVMNLALAHWRKVATDQKGGIYSAVLLLSLLLTLGVVGYFGPTGSWSLWLFRYIQVPIESSLMAILTVALAYSAARMLRQRINMFSVLFLLTALVILLGTAPLFGIEVPGLHGPDGIREFLAQVPAVAGARGIILGVALGTIATGLRVLMGADRPYGR